VIVIVSNGVQPKSAEAMVGRLLESWRTGRDRVEGVAVLGCNVRSMREDDRVYGLDALVWTPYACTVVEVKGFRSVQNGVLDPRINGTWRIGGADADLYTLDSAANPVAQGTDYMYAVKDNFTPANLPKWVNLLIVLAPRAEAHLTITSSQLKQGAFVVAATPDNDRSLRDYFTPAPGQKRLWSAEDVQRAFAILELDQYLPSPQQLAQEGFSFRRPPPAPLTHSPGQDDPFAPRPVPARPRLHFPLSPSIPRGRLSPLAPVPASRLSSPAPPPGPVEPRAGNRGRQWTDDDPEDVVLRDQPIPAFIEQPRRQRLSVDERYPLPPAAAPPPFAEPAPRRWSQWPGLDTAVSVLAIIFLAALLVLVVRCGDERSTPRTGDPARFPAGQIQPSPPLSPPRPAPPTRTPVTCMPFQAC
jgi:hypothetical protein